MTESVHGIKPGSTYRLYYGANNRNNKLIHVRAIVDGDQIVCRTWSKGKKRWNYYVEDAIYFDVAKEYLTKK